MRLERVVCVSLSLGEQQEIVRCEKSKFFPFIKRLDGFQYPSLLWAEESWFGPKLPKGVHLQCSFWPAGGDKAVFHRVHGANGVLSLLKWASIGLANGCSGSSGKCCSSRQNRTSG